MFTTYTQATINVSLFIVATACPSNASTYRRTQTNGRRSKPHDKGHAVGVQTHMSEHHQRLPGRLAPTHSKLCGTQLYLAARLFYMRSIQKRTSRSSRHVHGDLKHKAEGTVGTPNRRAAPLLFIHNQPRSCSAPALQTPILAACAHTSDTAVRACRGTVWSEATHTNKPVAHSYRVACKGHRG